MRELSYSNLPDFHDVSPFDNSDELCLEAVAEVLRRHGKLKRFGVTLLHKHFDVADDEILLETNDNVDRSLWIRPVSKNSLADLKPIPTSWRLDDGKVEMNCVCAPDSTSGEHNHWHQR